MRGFLLTKNEPIWLFYNINKIGYVILATVRKNYSLGSGMLGMPFEADGAEFACCCRLLRIFAIGSGVAGAAGVSGGAASATGGGMTGSGGL